MMEKEDEGYSVCPPPGTTFPALDYALDPHQVHHHHQVHPQHETTTLVENSSMVDYLLANPPPPHASASLDKLSFADVMQFADFGPKLALNQPRTTTISDDYNGIDPVYFLKFPVLNEKPHQDLLMTQPAMSLSPEDDPRLNEIASVDQRAEGAGGGEEQEEEGRESTSTRLRLLGGVGGAGGNEGKSNRRKRPRSVKTTEEVESQRMTHIAVERNRRKQMNEHLRVLRSLMPGSYVQRGDQASIIGGAIEFVRELEQLLQCLESQKRRRLFGAGDAGQRPIGECTPPPPPPQSPLAIHDASATQAPFIPSILPAPNEQMKLLDFDASGGGLREESAEIKSCLADIEVKLLGFDAMIKILSRRRPGQLLKTIAALEDLQFNILHTNITTIEQTVLYSFNIKIAGESRFTAEDIANSVQQIFNFIHASCL